MIKLNTVVVVHPKSPDKNFNARLEGQSGVVVEMLSGNFPYSVNINGVNTHFKKEELRVYHPQTQTDDS